MYKVKDYWENNHKKKFRKWLTGSHLQELLDFMNIEPFIKKGNHVLNIGVGMGVCTKELFDAGVIVDVLDISEKALGKVRYITENQYLSTNLNHLPKEKYDLAISHLVTQHINDKDLINQIKGVLPALKPNAVFAMQFAFTEGVDYEANYEKLQSAEYQMGGGVIRRLSDMEKIVGESDGKITWISDVRHYNHTIAKWQYIHIKNNNED